ncbi:MAG: hypothetical protein Q4F29_03865 [Lachnospiraceae bacterium]|nr:hypothetical protein [Lachnospiraceae bacterium]
MFEKKEGKRIFPLNRYFKNDYISRHMLGAFFSYTLCCLLGASLWILYHLEMLLDSISAELLLTLFRRFGLLYLAGLAVYLAATFWIYRKRYEYASGGLRVYVAKLKRLEKRYEYQNKVKEMAKEGVRHDGTSGV